MHRCLQALLLGLTLALAAGQAAARTAGHDDDRGGSHAWDDEDESHDRARRASARGEILTMAEILKRIRPQAPGRVLDTELEFEDGRWVYEIKLLDPKGRLYEVEIDARDGKILRRLEGE